MSVHLASYRKYRPQIFSEVIGQTSVVTILKNAVIFQKTTHSYLLCGTRGTGKTTLARLFAKALNCTNISLEGEPCNSCSSCREIMLGNGMDVLEIDGASHRGIDDIKQINETVFFSPGRAKFKIYIIDEVHMLTKEAFNALLKTLEEPPAHVKFFLATTEPHKIPLTILSRCQKINLNRIPEKLITQKLVSMTTDMGITCEVTALEQIAQAAQGSLRDAESFLDLVISYNPTHISDDVVRETLGLPDIQILNKIDHAIVTSDYRVIFETVQFIFDRGYDLGQFLNSLTLYYRDLLLSTDSTSRYSEEKLLYITEFLGEASYKLKQTIFERVFIETVLLHLINYQKHNPISELLKLRKKSQDTDEKKSILTERIDFSQKKTKISNATSSVNEEKKENKIAVKDCSETTACLKNERVSHAFNATHSTLPNTVVSDNILQFSAVEFQGVLTKE